jgi:arylsulfatase A-like enzyme
VRPGTAKGGHSAVSGERPLGSDKELAPDKPCFVDYVPGGTHAPHHPTQEWIDKIGAVHLFDDGWEKLRETIFANQKRLGIMSANAQLTLWPEGQAAFRAGGDRHSCAPHDRRHQATTHRRSLRPGPRERPAGTRRAPVRPLVPSGRRPR